MSPWNAQLAQQIRQQAQQQAAELAEAFARAWDLELESVQVGQTLEVSQVLSQLQGSGLVLFLPSGEQGALMLVPQSSGLLPQWYQQPDATGTSKLQTLAQEAGVILLPEELMPTGAEVQALEDLTQLVQHWHLDPQGTALPLELKGPQHQGTVWLCWPAQKASASSAAEEEETPKASQQAPAQPAPSGSASSPTSAPARKPRSLEELPPYIRSLLKVKLPVMVTLASKKMKVKDILQLVPGSIIQFDKSCSELLDLEVAGVRIAVGEAVKVGEKFGLRIRRMVPPREHYIPLRPRRRHSA